jgi:hypothetical protein
VVSVVVELPPQLVSSRLPAIAGATNTANESEREMSCFIKTKTEVVKDELVTTLYAVSGL